MAPGGNSTSEFRISTSPARTRASAELIAVENPATGETVEETVLAGPEDIEAAVSAATVAASDRGWSEDARLRSRVLYRWAERIEAASESLASLLTSENGKLLSESKIELAAFRKRDIGADGGHTVCLIAFVSIKRLYMINGRVPTSAPFLISFLSESALGY